MVVPCLFDGAGALLSDARDFFKAGGFVGDDVEGFFLEVVDNFIGVRGADARDESGAEVFADTVDVGGEGGFEGVDFKLVSILGVGDPGALEFEGFAALKAGKGAGDGDFLFFSERFEFGDGVVIFFVGVDDTFQDAG